MTDNVSFCLSIAHEIPGGQTERKGIFRHKTGKKGKKYKYIYICKNKITLNQYKMNKIEKNIVNVKIIAYLLLTCIRASCMIQIRR